MSKIEDSAPSGLSGTWKVFVGGCAVVVAIVGYLMIAGRASTAKWERYADKLRAAGQPLTFAEIEARRAAVPEERNSARVVERLIPRIDSLDPKNADGGGRWVLLFGTGVNDIDFFDAVPRYTLQPSRQFRDRNQALLDELATIKDMPTGRFTIEYNEEKPIFTLLPHLSSLRALSKLVHLEGILELADGRILQAVDNVELQFSLADTLHEEPMIISRLVQIALEALAVNGLEFVLRAGELDAPTLHRLGGAVDRRLASGTMKWGLLGERASWIGTCDGFATGKLRLSDLTSTANGISASAAWVPKTLLRANQLEGTRMHTTLVDAADDPRALLAAAQKLEVEILKLPRTQFLLRTFMPSLSRAMMLDIKVSAALECARTALAAESFRLRTGRLPTSLSELVPDDLPAVPVDPFNGQPLRLAVTERGLVIYSVGDNATDEGGDVSCFRKGKRCPDTGFRVLTPEYRGLSITDEPPPAEE